MKGIVVAFQGLLAADAKYKTTNAGKPFLSFGVLVGEDNTEKQWVSVLAWSESITDIHAYLKAGVEVYVEGKLKAGLWQGKDGPRVSLTVSATKVEHLGLIGKSKPKAPRAPRAKATKVDSQAPIEGRTAAPAFNDSIDDLF